MTNFIHIQVNQYCEGRTVKEVVGGCTSRRDDETRNASNFGGEDSGREVSW
jgi:hypothetical protein